MYLAETNGTVIFVVVLRMIRILNGLFQQHVRRKESLHREMETREEVWHCLSLTFH